MTKLSEDFVRLMTQALGEGEATALLAALEGDSPSSIRLNRAKPLPEELTLSTLSRQVPWCSWGYYLEERPVFTGDPRFHSGYYYVQEASSMLLSAIAPLLGSEPMRVLDVSAAPGGKTTLICDILPEGSVLVSNEVVRHRANILLENVQKWGRAECIVTSAMPSKLGKMQHHFDLVLVDAPCSGEGMFRKDLDARCQWTPDAPRLCAERQREILSDIWNALRPEGLMVYSTCTFNREENEDIVAYIVQELGAEVLALENLPEGVWLSPYSPYPCYRMAPNRLDGEGLFMVVCRKQSGEYLPYRSKSNKKVKSSDIPEEMKLWIRPLDYLWERNDEGGVIAYPQSLLATLNVLRSLSIPILGAGVGVGQIKGKNLFPSQALALSIVARLEVWDSVEVDEESIIPYLSRETISLARGLSLGIKLLRYKGIPLGFVKYLGNRSNNLYPQEWRIRHGEKLQQERFPL